MTLRCFLASSIADLISASLRFRIFSRSRSSLAVVSSVSHAPTVTLRSNSSAIEPVQRDGTAAKPKSEVADVDDALAGPGRALDPQTRRGMEARFGYDF